MGDETQIRVGESPAQDISAQNPTVGTESEAQDEAAGEVHRIAQYIFTSLSGAAEDGEIDFSAVALEVIQFANGGSLRPFRSDIGEVIDAAREEVFSQLIPDIESTEVRNMVRAQCERVFEAIAEELGRSNFELAEDPSISRDIPIPTGSLISNTSVNGWWQIMPHGILNGGVYRSGDRGIAATPYLALKYNFFGTDYPLLTTAISGAIGVAAIIPEENVENRYMLIAMPSLRLFMGSEQELFWGIKVREALQIPFTTMIGMHHNADVDFPVEFGAAFGKDFSDDLSISIGTSALFYLGARDVQDLGSFFPNYNNTDLFLNLRTSVVDVDLRFQFFNNEYSVEGALSKSFELFGGMATVAFVGMGSLAGDYAAYRPQGLLTFSYTYSSGNRDLGINSEISINPNYENYSNQATQIDVKYGDLLSLGRAYNYDATGQVVHCRPGREAAIVCYPESEEMRDVWRGVGDWAGRLTCSPPERDTMTCHVGGGYGSYTLDVTSNEDGLIDATISSGLEISDDFMNALFEYDDFESFANALKDLSYDNKIQALASMEANLYGTYDHRGPASVDTGDINDIDLEEMFKQFKEYLLDPEHAEPTTVCRGFAHFTTALAVRWGFEAHSVGVNTGDMDHVVTILREPGGEYQFINRGRIIWTDAITPSEAIQLFCEQMNYPPPLGFTLYEPNGYERRFKSNEGRMLDEALTPPDLIRDYLRFNQ